MRDDKDLSQFSLPTCCRSPIKSCLWFMLFSHEGRGFPLPPDPPLSPAPSLYREKLSPHFLCLRSHTHVPHLSPKQLPISNHVDIH